MQTKKKPTGMLVEFSWNPAEEWGGNPEQACNHIDNHLIELIDECEDVVSDFTWSSTRISPKDIKNPQVAWKWRKWTFGFWTDPGNWTRFGIDLGPLEVVWREEGYRQ